MITDIPIRKDIATCPICGGARFRNEEYCSKECREVGEYHKLARHGVPERIDQNLLLGKVAIDLSVMSGLVKALIADLPGVYLFGSVGTGKSFTAAAILRIVFEDAQNKAKHARRTGDWQRGNLLAVANAWTTPEAYCRAEFNKQPDALMWRKSPLLVLDDLGREIHSAAMLDAVTALVDERLERKRKTIITSNLSLAQIEATDATGGARLASRLALFRVVQVNGKDRRLSRT